MKKLYEKSKQQVLDKLKYFNAILVAIADMVKSFATIIGSLVAGTTAGVTGYYEIKKMVKKEKYEYKNLPSNTSAITSTASPLPDGYRIDMNTGTFAVSFLMFAILVFVKMKKNVSGNKS